MVISKTSQTGGQPYSHTSHCGECSLDTVTLFCGCINYPLATKLRISKQLIHREVNIVTNLFLVVAVCTDPISDRISNNIEA